jgi:hypothetical protein
MANSREDLFDARNLESYVKPTSEVGSRPLITVVEQLATIVQQLTQPREQRPSAEFETLSLPRLHGDVGIN